jgi:cysteine desulfurase / selenocysteine lyase
MWDFKPDRLELPGSAKRFEFGTMAYGTALGATHAIEYLLEISPERIFAHNRVLSTRLSEGLERLGGEILSPRNMEERSATVAVRFPGKNSAEFARTLKSNNVVASLRADFLRFSPHLYNSVSDIDRALEAIDATMRGV